MRTPDSSSTYDRLKEAPLPWFNKSSDLRAAAGALWYCMQTEHSKGVVEELRIGNGFSMGATHPVYTMLCGLSLELLYKAIAIANRTTPQKNHKLIEHARTAGIRINKQSEGILKILTQSIEWEGKYPVPRQSADMAELYNLSLEHLYEKIQNGTTKLYHIKPDVLDWEHFNKLWSQAARVFHDITKRPPEHM